MIQRSLYHTYDNVPYTISRLHCIIQYAKFWSLISEISLPRLLLHDYMIDRQWSSTLVAYQHCNVGSAVGNKHFAALAKQPVCCTVEFHASSEPASSPRRLQASVPAPARPGCRLRIRHCGSYPPAYVPRKNLPDAHAFLWLEG